MSYAGRMDFEEILRFWFGELDAEGRADEAHSKRWWKKDAAFDEEIRARFQAVHAAVSGGRYDDWLVTPRGRLAYVIVLDQFSRNMYRGTGRMFEGDQKALQAVLEGMRLGADRELAHAERSFFYMPLMHSEDVAVQQRSVSTFEAWRDELAGDAREKVVGLVKYAEQHRDIVRRFGRFPHRNALCDRTSTHEEEEFLKQPGSSF